MVTASDWGLQCLDRLMHLMHIQGRDRNGVAVSQVLEIMTS